MRASRPIVALALLAAAPALAKDALDEPLARLERATRDDYPAALEAVRGVPGARSLLEARLQAAKWTDETFRGLALTEIALARVASQDACARVLRLEGLDADRYLRRMQPRPECGRELKRLVRDGAGPLLELLLETGDLYPFTRPETASAFVKSKAKDVAGLAGEERAALREGLVVALAGSGHPAAFFCMKRVARDASEPEGARIQAVQGLGTIGTSDALAEIVSIRGDASLPASLRGAAVAAAAHVPSAAALDFLANELAAPTEAERRQAAVALGTFGSHWAWRARPAAVAATGDALRSRAALLLVGAIEREPSLEAAIVDSIGMIAHPAARAPLAKLAGEGSSPEVRAAASRALARLDVALGRH
jgi:hypothetical protein